MAYSASSGNEIGDRRYIAAAMRAPMLEREYETELGRRWRDKEDQKALDELVTSHVRLAVKIASGFRGYGLPVSDLIQEGNIGLLEAAKRFDPEKGVRFSTYASWWILAGVQEFIVRNASIIRLGSTPAQKKLFFNLRRLRAKIASVDDVLMTDANRQEIADILKVPINAVERMEAHLSGPDRSLNITIGEDGDELQNFLKDDRPNPEEIVIDRVDSNIRGQWLQEALDTLSPREKDIIQHRFMDGDKTTLADIGESYGVTKERIRQIESRALGKLKDVLEDAHGADAPLGNA
ncbi:MAG: RNA polymerase factor sigma-32 [Rhodospirillaceae bacterium]|jgi:RNA polymerase sigma-32 factor|nr:RNA polymerase factor sigma-32 [Rhodospirillaceae bacterium]MBT5459460.1 RNA polymerase factor sigma-32 [Rhodospirillaceae bacterium]